MENKKDINKISLIASSPAIFAVILGSALSIIWGLEWWQVWILGFLFIISGAWAILMGQERLRRLKELK